MNWGIHKVDTYINYFTKLSKQPLYVNEVVVAGVCMSVSLLLAHLFPTLISPRF